MQTLLNKCETYCKSLHNTSALDPSLCTYNITLWNSLCHLLQAVWTRFFPASVEIRRLLAQEEVGEVKMVKAEFGVPLMNVPRSVQKELGGGAVLDLGIYCLQFITMVYNGEKPECVQAMGVCLETGNSKQAIKISQI